MKTQKPQLGLSVYILGRTKSSHREKVKYVRKLKEDNRVIFKSFARTDSSRPQPPSLMIGALFPPGAGEHLSLTWEFYLLFSGRKGRSQCPLHLLFFKSL